jgi:pimeloyl-ACP methyl ester carboxylesterase
MKKIIAVTLSVILAFSVSVTSFAAFNSKECDCGYVPVIYVTGFAQTPLAANAGTENQYNVFIPDAKIIVAAVASLVVPIVMLVITGNYDTFADSLTSALNGALKDIACDNNGVPVNDTVDIVKRDKPTANHAPYTESVFRYDWREDVFDVASELNDFVEETKELTGHDKVALTGESMGGAVVMTYLEEYGNDSVDSVIMQSSAYNGITLMGGLFTGDLDIKAAPAMNYIGNFIEGNDMQTVILRFIFNTYCGAVINPVAGILDSTIKNCKDKLYKNCLDDLLGNIPGLWTFVPQEYYEAAKSYMLDENENAELIKKIDRYHYGVMDKTKELLDKAIADGVKVSIISHYGKAATPVITNDNYQCDFLIDTMRTSQGATCADYGSTLGDGYVQAVSDGHNHISCDNIVDASTCMYPEQTWFIKDMMHTWYSTGYYSFIYWLAYSKTQPTVWDNPSYPQFLCNNHETGKLEVLTKDNENTQDTDVGKYIAKVVIHI